VERAMSKMSFIQKVDRSLSLRGLVLVLACFLLAAVLNLSSACASEGSSKAGGSVQDSQPLAGTRSAPNAVAPGSIDTGGSQGESVSIDQLDDSSSPAASGKTLQGGVRGTVMLTEDGLKRIGETTHELRRWSLQLVGETSKKETVPVLPPNVLPNGVVIPAIPQPSGTIQMGHVPATRGMVGLLMSRTEYQVKLLRNEVNALIIPDNKMEAVAEPWGRIRGLTKEIISSYRQLKTLTTAPSYDDDKIARAASDIYYKAEDINKLRKKVMKIVKSG